MSANQDQAVAQWSELLGADAVTTAPAELAALQRNTTGYAPRVLVAALRPSTVEQMSDVVRIARRHGVALSRTAPARTGDSAPGTARCTRRGSGSTGWTSRTWPT